MIYPQPTDEILRAADLIALYDPGVPSWHKVISSLLRDKRGSSAAFLVVDIPVDSTDASAVQLWKDRIVTARSG